jgi:hypothetical protein
MEEHNDLPVFDQLDFALEEAEFLFKTTGKDQSVVALPDKNGNMEHFIVMEKSRALATAAFILESFIAVDKGEALGVH